MHAMPAQLNPGSPALIARVNRLYHDLTQHEFDVQHRYRHRVEAVFWCQVAEAFAHAGTDGHATRPGRTIVDLACGSGFVADLLGASLNSTDRLIAMDLSTGALRATARKWSATRLRKLARLNCLAGDGRYLPLPDASADLLAMNAALHHMPDVGRVLSEVHRVLKPGGWFALGFEPNVHHFASCMGRLSFAFDRLAWYASPRQNLRRARSAFAHKPTARSKRADHQVGVVQQVNAALRRDYCLSDDLSADAVLNLVDPHARGAESCAGFNPTALLCEHFAGYRVIRLMTSDYLGETPRRCRPFRSLVDAGLRLAWPSRGGLFSWIIRKPAGTSQPGKEDACPR